MDDTYTDANGAERHDECEELIEYCTCVCPVTDELILECAGPGCEHEES